MKKTLLIGIIIMSGYYVRAQTSLTNNDINPGSGDSKPRNLSVFNNKLFFYANDGSNGQELWRIDTAGVPSLVYNINPGAGDHTLGIAIEYMAVLNSKLYFSANNGTNGMELYEYDGINAPMLTEDIVPGPGASSILFLTVLNNKLYFSAETPANGRELWEYDPATTIAQRLTDIKPGITSSDVSYLTVFNNKIYFTASSTSAGVELFVYDPTTTMTTMVADINTGAANSLPANYIAYNNNMYFCANTSTYGNELYKYDGTNPPLRITDINPGAAASLAPAGSRSIVAFKNNIYFAAQGASGGFQLYKYDVGTGVPSLVHIINTIGDAYPVYFAIYNDKLYFRANDGSNGVELWSYDGTNTPAMVADINAGVPGSNPLFFAEFNKHLYFSATDATTGEELYRFIDSSVYAGITNINFAGDVRIYPNPATEETNIIIALKKTQLLNITISDALGKTVYTSGCKQYGIESTILTIPMRSWAAGSYFYRVSGETGDICVAGRLLKN